MIAIAGVLAWGTIYETRFGTASVQRFIYQAWWFHALLAFLAINLAVSAIDRYPWKLHHAPFLMAHLGIILILVGGIIGGRWGIDGQLIIPEGQAENVLRLSRSLLVVTPKDAGTPRAMPTNFETQAWVHEPHRTFALRVGDRPVTLTVDRYYPNAEVAETVVAGGEGGQPAVHLRLLRDGQEQDAWLVAGDPERFGLRWQDLHVLFLEPADETQLAALLGAASPMTNPRGVVTVELTDLRVRQSIPVPDDLTRPVPLEGTPYTITFKDYFTDFAITDEGIANRSHEPNNPAVSFTLTGPEGSDAFLLFSLHPDFPAIHGRKPTLHAHATYTRHDAPPVPPDAIAIVRHPSGALSGVLTGGEGERHLVALEPGRRYRHPWSGDEFEILASEPRARVIQEFVSRDDEVRQEALHVVAKAGDRQADAWVTRGTPATLSLGGAPIGLEYRNAEFELPVTIKLLDFRKIDYPGTQMAAGFEADVELMDAKRGVMLMRTIKMNKPLKYRGWTFFQASFIPGTPETTVLAVRKDPGTPLVYTGFIIVIMGVVSLFAMRSRRVSARLQGAMA